MMSASGFIKCHKGVTLVELLVSMLIAGIIFAGVVSVVQMSQQSFVSEQENSFIQENARYALETMSRDIRMAGSYGCANPNPSSPRPASFSNVVGGDVGELLDTDAVIGFEGSGGIDTAEWPDAYQTSATSGSDSIILRYADPETNIYIQNHNNFATGSINLHAAHSWSAGEKVLIVDSTCRHIGMFEATGSPGIQLGHDVGGGSPGNASLALYDSSVGAYGSGSSLMAFVSNGYFIGNSNVVPGTPALKRQVLTSGGSRAEELAQGVEDMELLFGVSTETDAGTPSPDGDVDAFLRADEVADWDTVIAVRVLLIVRSLTEVHSENQTTTINGVTYTDRFLRQMVSSTVRMRNRG